MPSIPEDELNEQIDIILDNFGFSIVNHEDDSRASLKSKPKQQILAAFRQYAAKERLDETEKHQRALQRPPKGIDTGYMNIDLIEMNFAIRIKQLKKGVKT